MKELQKEAKELGINSFGKTADSLKEEIGKIKGDEKPVRRTAEDAESRAAAIREQRRESGVDPLTPQYKLHTLNQKPGWKYFWAKDTKNRIYDLKRRGYQIDESVEPISAGDNSGGDRMIRVMIPDSIYKEDFARKQNLIQESEKALREANIKGGIRPEDGVYGDISIGQKSVKLGSKQG